MHLFPFGLKHMSKKTEHKQFWLLNRFFFFKSKNISHIFFFSCLVYDLIWYLFRCSSSFFFFLFSPEPRNVSDLRLFMTWLRVNPWCRGWNDGAITHDGLLGLPDVEHLIGNSLWWRHFEVQSLLSRSRDETRCESGTISLCSPL